jgi:hypothetical protein
MFEPGGEEAAVSNGPVQPQPRVTVPKLRNRAWSLLDALAGADNDPDMYKFAEELGEGETVDRLIKRLNTRSEAFVRERTGLRLWRTLIVFFTAVIPILFFFEVVNWADATNLGDWDWRLGGCLVFLEFFLLILLLFVRARVANLGAQLVILEYEKVLITFDETHEKRAADLFFKHQAELKQYYDQTLRQNRQSFIVGILCIAFGLTAIAGVTILLLGSEGSTTAAKLAAGGFGILAVLLTGFVARIYLRVYEGSAEALGSFHERLVNTNDYHFAGLLVSMIEPKSKRMEAQSALAAAITGSHRAGSED